MPKSIMAAIRTAIRRMTGTKPAPQGLVGTAPSAPDPGVPPVPVDVPDPGDWTDAQLEALAAGKAPPRRIHEDGDRIAYYQATDAERLAWNDYAGEAVEAFNSNPCLDSYDSVDVYPGFTRAGSQIPWIPPVRFPEWLAARRAGTQGGR